MPLSRPGAPDSDPLREPIAALASAEGPAPVSVVRVSGTGSWSLLASAVGTPTTPTPRRLLPVSVAWEEGAPPLPGRGLFFQGSASYTGEESVELYLPGNPPLLRALLGTLRRAGIRPAEPGEFTRRAFLNGRLDLTRAESVRQLIEAESRDEADAARRTLEGDLARAVEAFGDGIHDLVAHLEACLDFAEQEVEPPGADELGPAIVAIEEGIESFLSSGRAPVREEARVRFLLAGRANAGKSTLFNALLGTSRAIASDTPGTTRDPVSGIRSWPGGPEVEFVDLPGERVTDDEVEQAAFRLRDRHHADADTVLLVLDGTRPEAELLEECRRAGPNAWPVLNKCDALPDGSQQVLAAIDGVLRLSALTGDGLDALHARITERLRGGEWLSRGRGYLFTERQHDHLGECRDLLRATRETLEAGPVPPELTVIDLRRAHDRLAEITGTLGTEETLDRIFHRFCLGK